MLLLYSYVIILLSLHSSLGVHISFVRSIAMDSWTDQQLALMKGGGNDQCNQYLQKHGIAPRTPIKQKYESPAAQLYKAVLKARIEGRPEPTELPKPAQPKSGDASGMERLAGETDAQYVTRQTRLREEARVRMANKFGGGGSSSFGSSGSGSMQGIGSDKNYNPNSGGYSSSNGSGFVSGIGAGLGAAFGTAGSLAGSIANEQTLNSVKSTAGSFWGSLSSSVSNVAQSLVVPDSGSDGLSQLQHEFSSQRPTTSKYSGFGSADSNRSGAAPPNNYASAPPSFGTSPAAGGLQEAPGLAHEDKNGMERLTGEMDEQYVVRQTRLREEARARMAAKFGGGGLSSAGSGISGVSGMPSHKAGTHSAPSSGNAPKLNNGRSTTPPPPKTTFATTPENKTMNSNDFFSNFGT
jgi:ADP-ribosylation factor GTPase-activating protein 1